MSHGKSSRSGSSKQPPHHGNGSTGEQDLPSRPFSLPLGYYERYGIRPPEPASGAIQARRYGAPASRPIPRGLLEYYGVAPQTTDGEPAHQVQPKGEARAEPTQRTEPAAPPMSENEQVHEAAATGIAGPSGSLPYLDQIQKSFGSHDVSHIKAHTDSQAATGARAMGAEAFTTGDHVAFAGSPTLHTAAHEAAHVLQQRAGVQLKGGVGQVGDRYEQHADAVADRVVQGKSSEALLNEYAGGAAGLQAETPLQARTIQRSPPGGASAPAKAETDADSWRGRGNLRGHPPVRDEKNPPNKGIIEDEAVYNQRYDAALASMKQQKERAQGMLKGGTGRVLDNRYWFSQVYFFVTEEELKAADGRTFFYPSYVLQCVRFFEQIYADNVAAANQHGTVEMHWRKAFEEAAKHSGVSLPKVLGGLTGGGAGALIVGGAGGLVGGVTGVAIGRMYDTVASLVASMKAHIRFDLPRAEAWVFNNFYATMQDARLQNFMPDFMSMTGVFERAANRLNPIIAEKTLVPVTLVPRMLQDMGMEKWFDADMATERADTWRRAEELQSSGKAGSGPYTEGGERIKGSVTINDNLSGIQNLPTQSLRPSMDDSAAIRSDTEIRQDVARSGKSGIAARPTIERIQMLRRLRRGMTFDADENTMLDILRASQQAGDFATVVDGANAWDMYYAIDGAEAMQLRTLLRADYYAQTSADVAITLICRCMDGETAEWEEQMVADILVARHGSDGRALVERIGRQYKLRGDNDYQRGLNKLESQLDGNDETRVTALYGSSGLWW